MATLDVGDLEGKVQQMYRQVTEQPHASYHFEMGRALAQQQLSRATRRYSEVRWSHSPAWAISLTWRAFSTGRPSSIWAAAQEWIP